MFAEAAAAAAHQNQQQKHKNVNERFRFGYLEKINGHRFISMNHDVHCL